MAQGARPPRRLACRSSVCAALVALGAWTGLATAACKVSPLELPVTMVGSRAVAKVAINGTEVRLIIDSGAFYSFLSDAAAAQLQLPIGSAPWGLRVMGLTGPVETRLTTVKRLGLLDGELADVDFLVGGNDTGSGTLGVIGRNLLAATDTEYDLAHGVIRLMFPNDDCSGADMAYWSGSTPVTDLPLRRDEPGPTPALRATAQLNGKNVRVLFDTGAMSMVSLASAHRAGVTDAEMTPAGRIRGAGAGETQAWSASFAKFELGSETIENNRLRIADFGSSQGADMLLGIDFFLSHRIYVSKSRRHMYFTYNGGPVFSLNTGAVTADGASGAEEPENAAGYARRGAARAARRDYARALDDLDRACDLAPLVAENFVQRGMVHEALKQPARAQADFDTALRLDAAQTDARWQRALLRLRARDRAGALDDLQALDGALAPQAQLRLDLSRLYSRLGLQAQALAQLNLWIPVHPNESDVDTVLNERCWLRTMLGVELQEAVRDCARALDSQPKNAAFLDSRAWLHLRRGEVNEALVDYDRALQIKPDSAWTLYGRGLARTRLGDAAQGSLDIDAARKLLPVIDAEAGRHGLALEPQVPPQTK